MNNTPAKGLLHNWSDWNFEVLGRPKIEDYEMPTVLKALKMLADVEDVMHRESKISKEFSKHNTQTCCELSQFINSQITNSYVDNFNE